MGATHARSSVGPAPEAICKHALEVSRPEVARRRRLSERDEDEFIRRCAAAAEDEREESDEHWRCVSSCWLDANSATALHQCDAACPLPTSTVDCDTALAPAAMSAAFGAPLTPVIETSKGVEGTGWCSRRFRISGGSELLVSLGASRLRAAARNVATQSRPDERDAEPVSGVGDLARRAERPFEGGTVLCTLQFAKSRIVGHVSVNATRCDFRALKRVASAIADKL